MSWSLFMLAMHMNNELLTPTVAFGFIVLAGGILGLASRRVGAVFDPAKVPLMGVLGAFVFAAQMINFPIGGTSGHLIGSVLLAILLGPHAATLVMASILIVQCLIFQDGGLLALGTNILNMGILPSYLGYALFRLAAGRSPNTARLYGAIVLATLVGITAGAAMVPVETELSGVLAVPFSRFLLVMIGMHLLIALVEAVITFGVVAYVIRVRPQLLEAHGQRLTAAAGRLSPRALAASLLVVALLLGGVGSLFASRLPDVLDSITSPNAAQQSLVQVNSNPFVKSAGGVFGTLLTLLLIWVIGRFLQMKAKNQKPKTEIHSHPSG